ncbi:unnamed protein product [Victoria cruziana]
MDEERWWRWRMGDEGSRGIGGAGDGGEVGESVDRCSMRRVVKNHCWTEEVEPGNFVRKCEKTEQLLRKCAGRPVEVVESDTEYSEENVSYNMYAGSLPHQSSDPEPFKLPYESSDPGPFTFPGLRRDLDFFERGIAGSFSRFVEAAEEMKNYFQSLGGFSHDGESASRSTKSVDIWYETEQIPVSSSLPRDKRNESEYSEYAGKTTDV